MTDLRYRGLRYHRSASAAFRDASYGAAIERPRLALWRRALVAFWIWL